MASQRTQHPGTAANTQTGWALPRLSPTAIRQGLAGAAGGLLVFLLLELAGRSAGLQTGTGSDGNYDAWRENVFAVGAVFGAVVTAVLSGSAAWWSGSRPRIIASTVAGAAVGAVLSTGYSIIGNFLYDFTIALSEMLGGVLRVFARTGGWAVFGLGVGLSAGLITRSTKRTYQGCLGGLVGGFLGGICFDLLTAFTGGVPGRLVGYVVLGAAVGLATALAEQMGRDAWLTFLTGSREGSEVSLHKIETVLGRDELVDIPLFGDNQVDHRQAVLSLHPEPTIHDVGGNPLLRVDGRAVQVAPLLDGTLLQIGAHRLRFHCRTYSTTPEELPGERELLERLLNPESAPVPGWARDQPASASPAQFIDEEQTLTWSPSSSGFFLPPPTETGLFLRILSGRAKGTRIHLGEHGITLGRDESNTLPVPDSRVSRHHARIEPVEGAWVYTDLNSTNGSFLNGLRIVRAGLALGDELLLGDTRIIVEQAGAV